MIVSLGRRCAEVTVRSGKNCYRTELRWNSGDKGVAIGFNTCLETRCGHISLCFAKNRVRASRRGPDFFEDSEKYAFFISPLENQGWNGFVPAPSLSLIWGFPRLLFVLEKSSSKKPIGIIHLHDCLSTY